MIKVNLPAHLRELARIDGLVYLQVSSPVSVSTVLNELEAKYPMLKGTIRDQNTYERRPFIRYFACGEDLSLDDTDNPLSDAVVNGIEVLRIVGAMAGG